MLLPAAMQKPRGRDVMVELIYASCASASPVLPPLSPLPHSEVAWVQPAREAGLGS